MTELTKEQQNYYKQLETTLTEQRAPLQLGLENEIEADLQRRRDLVEWERGLLKAEILLRVDSNVALNKRLLMVTMAQTQLGTLDHVSTLQSIDRRRVESLLALYDAILAATKKLEENSKVISEYLGSRDSKFALRSVDTAALAATAGAVRFTIQVAEGLTAEAAAERMKEQERWQQDLDRARKLLVDSLGGS